MSTQHVTSHVEEKASAKEDPLDDSVLYLIGGTALLQGSGLREYFESGFQSRVLRAAWSSPTVVALNVLGGVCSVVSVYLAMRAFRRLADAGRTVASGALLVSAAI